MSDDEKTEDATTEDATTDVKVDDADVEAVPTDEPTTDEGTGSDAGPGFLRQYGGFLLAAVLVLAAVVLFVVQPSNDDDGNVAVVDGRATTQVVDAVTAGLEGSFAYDFRDPGKSEKVADAFFTGDAVDDYATLRESVASLGKDQSLVYETDVTNVGVRSLDGDKAEVLAFIDQSSTRGTDGAVQEAAAQVVLDLVRTDGTWKVSDLQQL